jgi:hypothetical protein
MSARAGSIGEGFGGEPEGSSPRSHLIVSVPVITSVWTVQMKR